MSGITLRNDTWNGPGDCNLAMHCALMDWLARVLQDDAGLCWALVTVVEMLRAPHHLGNIFRSKPPLSARPLFGFHGLLAGPD